MTGRINHFAGGIAALSAVVLLTLAGSARADGTEACGFSGADISCVFTQYPHEQMFEIPPGVRHVTIEAIGAAGGRGYTAAAGVTGATGESGGRVLAPLTIPDGVSTLYVEVGGPGGDGAPQSAGAGGYNGGGIGGAGIPGSGGGGGGASDVRTCSITATVCPGGGDSLHSRLVVAAGGGGGGAGGGGFGEGFVNGGIGGVGADGFTANGGSGAAVISGDARGGGGATTARSGAAGRGVLDPLFAASAGAIGSGGAGAPLTGSYGGGGGGAGWFGGGGGGTGGYAGGGGGAGSSFGPDGTTFSHPTDSMGPEIRITYATDTTPPAISIAAPVQDATYAQGQTVDAAYTCSDDGVGVASCSGTVPAGQPIDTSTPGTHTFTVTATDNTDNQSTQTVTYNVQAPAIPPVTFVTPNPPADPNPPASPNPPVSPVATNSPSGQTSPAPAPGAPTAPRGPGHGPAQTSPPSFVNTAAPVISGTSLVGHMLVASPGHWSRTARLHYQWKRCTAAGTRCRNVAHATARSYRLTGADIGYKLTVTVNAVDARGRRASASAHPVGPIARWAHHRGRTG
jgi:hypothetical protein